MKERLLRASFIETALLVCIFAFALFADSVYAASLSWKFCFVVSAIALFLVLPGFLLWERRNSLWLFAIFCASLATLYLTALTPVKPFTQFYNDIQNDMSKSQVQQLLAQHFPSPGKFPLPVANFRYLTSYTPASYESPLAETPNQALQYTLDPTDGRYNAEFVMIYLKDGRVLGKQYLCD